MNGHRSRGYLRIFTADVESASLGINAQFTGFQLGRFGERHLETSAEERKRPQRAILAARGRHSATTARRRPQLFLDASCPKVNHWLPPASSSPSTEASSACLRCPWAPWWVCPRTRWGGSRAGEYGDHGTKFRDNVDRLIDILRIPDVAEQAVIRAAASQDTADPRSGPTFLEDGSGGVDDDAFVSMLCLAVQQESVSEANAVDFAKQAQFMRGGRWHDD